jgi:hypothetical protein
MAVEALNDVLGIDVTEATPKELRDGRAVECQVCGATHQLLYVPSGDGYDLAWDDEDALCEHVRDASQADDDDEDDEPVQSNEFWTPLDLDELDVLYALHMNVPRGELATVIGAVVN